MATITHGTALPDSSNKTDFYNMVDNASVSQIVNADLSNSAAIAYSKLALAGMLQLTDLSVVIPQIIFWENDIVSYQNEMVTST
jgi:hypothetical protein